MVKRKSKTAVTGQDDIKQGNLVWVKYKGIDWPAKVSNIYPKKITYYYLPLDAAVPGQPFKTNNPKAVKLIQVHDKIPACPDSKLIGDLQRAFKQAKEILQNPNEPLGLDETSGSSALNGSLQQDDEESQVSNQESPSTKRKKESKKELRSEHDLDEPEDEIDYVDTHNIIFNVGDVVIVASEIGTWPGKILEIFDDHTICKLFPLTEKNEPCRVVWENVQEFPKEQLDEYMEETRNNENLYLAFEDVKRYLEGDAGGSVQATKETKTKVRGAANAKEMGRKMNRKRRASSERESEVESDRETNSRHESRPKRRHENSSNEKASKKMQNSVADAVPADPVAKKVTKPKSFLDTITSDEAEQYIKSIWEGKFKNQALNGYTKPSELHQLHFNFNNGGLMNFADVEKAIPKIKNMIKISPKLPKMSELVEFHYIANVLVPELYVFGLSKIDGTTLDKAREKFEELVANEANSSEIKNDRAATSNGSFKISNSLLMAASRAKTEEEEEQKPDI